MGHKETGCIFLPDSLVCSRLNGSCKSAETRESGGVAGTGKVSEKCLLPLMAWFICFHIHCREPDPKVSLCRSSGKPNKNICSLEAEPHHQEAANKPCHSLIKLRFKLNRSHISCSAACISSASVPLLLSLQVSVRLMHSVFFPSSAIHLCCCRLIRELLLSLTGPFILSF